MNMSSQGWSIMVGDGYPVWVWLDVGSATKSLTFYEARLLGEALLMAAKRAEEEEDHNTRTMYQYQGKPDAAR